MATVGYRVQVHQFSGSFGIGPLLVDLTFVKNVGWADYLDDVPEAFFTLNQDDPQIIALRTYVGKAHVRILRQATGGPWDTVWTGWLMEHDAKHRDAVFSCYGYLAGLWWLHTDWAQTWTSQTIGTIITDLWTRAKTTLTSSNLNFVVTGTIEAPVTTSGGAVAIILPSYRTYYKRILLAFQELAAISQSDTNNGVIFEITHSNTPTFNFWKNAGVDRTAMIWDLDGAVADFREIQVPVYHRNQMLAVGTPSTESVFRVDLSDGGDIANWGRRQESLYFQWVRDELELDRVTRRRLAMAIREDMYLELTFAQGRVLPPGVTGATWRLGDRIRVRIDRGITTIDEYRLATGVQVIWTRGVEYIRAINQQRPGA